MPIANGGNLRDYLKANKKLSIDKKMKIVKGIASGIMKIHGEGITHENIVSKYDLNFYLYPYF